MKKLSSIIAIFLYSTAVYSQLTVNNNPPNDSPTYLIDAILLGNGVQATNHQYQGDSIQIGYFDGTNSNLGFNSGIVLCTEDIAVLDPGFTGVSANVDVTPEVTDPDLLTVANSVPPLINQNFTIGDINDVAVLEFDFIPSSDSVSFRYIFASREYFGYENTQYNDVFGFFISGPGISGPYASPANFPNGSINIATIEDASGTIMPVTISSVNASINSEFFVNNQGLETVANASGFTIPLIAEAAVQCGETYHIRLAIADGSDGALSSYVFLEENSFTSATVNVSNSLGFVGNRFEISCGSLVNLTADVSAGDNLSYLWNTGETTQSISVGAGSYVVQATVDGCLLRSDTIIVTENSILLDLKDNLTVCPSDVTTISVESIQNASPPFSYLWSTGQTSPTIEVPIGTYSLRVTDSNGCEATDSVVVRELSRPTATLTGGGNICEGQTDNFPRIEVQFSGNPPFHFTYTNWVDFFQNSTYFHSYEIIADTEGYYFINQFADSLCEGSASNTIEVTLSTSKSLIKGGELICEGDSTLLTVHTKVDAPPYDLYLYNGSFNQVYDSLMTSNFEVYVYDSAHYTVSKLIDSFDCESQTNNGLAVVEFKDPYFPVFTMSIDSILCPVDPPILLEAWPDGGVFSGKGVDFDGYFHPINAFEGKSWLYYSFPNNCNETDSISVEVNCDVQLFVPNSISPNGDFINDTFVIQGNNILNFELFISSRWGEVIFHTKDMNHYWDGKYKGKVVPVGVYGYTISAYGKDSRLFTKNGSVNVVQ